MTAHEGYIMAVCEDHIGPVQAAAIGSGNPAGPPSRGIVEMAEKMSYY